MEIRKLFGQEAQKASGQKKREEIEQYQGQGQAQVARPGEDVVSLSNLSRQLLQVSDIVAEDSIKRSARVAELKKSVEDGTYSVSSTDVAQSLVSFAAELAPQREV